jgi:broad specificity phosphatase PhoE
LELLFVRHGQPAWADEGKPQMDPGLTETGIDQAARAAERIARRGADEVISSNARRALQTAKPIGEAVGKEIVVVPELTELRLPDWSHLSLEEVAREFRKAREREPLAWWEGLPGGESFRVFATRIQRALDDVLGARGGKRIPGEEAPIWSFERDLGRIVIVGHGGTNSVAASLLLGISPMPWEWERVHLNHCAFLRLSSVPLGRGVIFSLRASNDCEHLPRALRTA